MRKIESDYIQTLNHDKLNEYNVAKEWGYDNYIQLACGINKYAIQKFIEDFEKWYNLKYNIQN
jgi:hypothetical protein